MKSIIHSNKQINTKFANWLLITWFRLVFKIIGKKLNFINKTLLQLKSCFYIWILFCMTDEVGSWRKMQNIFLQSSMNALSIHNNSNPETSAISSTSSTLKFPALGPDIWLGVAMWNTRSWTKMSHSFTRILRTSKEYLHYAKNIFMRSKFLITIFKLKTHVVD